MARFDYPDGIRVDEKTNEQNIQYMKSYLIETVDSLTYQMNQIESELRAEIDSLRQQINDLGG